MKSTIRTARLPHRCPMCMTDIEAGTRYLEMVALPGSDDIDFLDPPYNKPSTTRVHLRCWYRGPEGERVIAELEA